MRVVIRVTRRHLRREDTGLESAGLRNGTLETHSDLVDSDLERQELLREDLADLHDQRHSGALDHELTWTTAALLLAYAYCPPDADLSRPEMDETLMTCEEYPLVLFAPAFRSGKNAAEVNWGEPLFDAHQVDGPGRHSHSRR